MKLSFLAACLALGFASAAIDICEETGLENITANYCTCSSTTVGTNPVAVLECGIGNSSDIFYAKANATLFPCTKTAKFIVGLSAMGTDYGTFEVDMGQSDHIMIPGLSYNVTIASETYAAQGYLDVSMKGNTEDFVAQIDIDFCLTFLGAEFCGEELSPQLPYNLVTGELTTTGIC
eukprot:CAMPEP_0195517716 /NCGR_PEP_ID=MMETSP0794_2-20130614/11460_1 /TAXON_ID=515487 /ORGANISM="Stephanopyxis turris, Strain CCMP 815" /LENGTH=176 /DNA_ID=CAMNT_0040646581 /DNA_START=66 /DNA_END=596 /DNA_ORIENTATION=+